MRGRGERKRGGGEEGGGEEEKRGEERRRGMGGRGRGKLEWSMWNPLSTAAVSSTSCGWSHMM